jgi:uncharacterized lipoprotein YajG
MRRLALILVLTGCASTQPVQHVVPPSVAPVKAEISKAQQANTAAAKDVTALDGKAEVVLEWFRAHLHAK